MWNKISFKLIVGVSGIVTAIIGVFAYIILDSFQSHVLGDVERFAEQLSETVKSSTRYDMLLNRRESLHEIINTIGSQESIEKVRVYNKEGEIILSSDSSDVGSMVDQRAEACYACHAADQPLENVPVSSRTRLFFDGAGHRVFGIINPVYNERSCWEAECHAHSADQKVLGVLDITVPLTELDRDLNTSRARLLILALLVIAAVSLIIFWLAERIVLKPIGEVVTATHRVASGDLGYTVPVRRNDELGELATSFNGMTKKLSEAQRQLFQSDKLASVGRLAAGVAHEINNPLTGVLTYSSFLLSRLKDDKEISADLEVVVRETKRCREIVKGLLDFSRQSAPEKRPVDVNEAILHAAAIVQNQLSFAHVRFVLNLADGLPAAYADANQLEQVLVNLFVNAGDAMTEKGGSISVESAAVRQSEPGHPDRGYVQISIKDTGCGIPPDNLGKVFDPFFTTKGQKGNGLGLAIVWGIIEEHNGRISLASEVGKGTTFTILIPQSDHEHERA